MILDVYATKENIEIVGWREINDRALEQLKKQAEREDGQLLILPSESSEEAGALSGPTVDMPSEGKGSEKVADMKPKEPTKTQYRPLYEALDAVERAYKTHFEAMKRYDLPK